MLNFWTKKGGAPKGWRPRGWRPKPKFNERTPREREKNENCGGRGKKKCEILGGPVEGCPAEGCPEEGCPSEGGSPEGGAGFLVSGSVQVFRMKREMSKNKKK